MPTSGSILIYSHFVQTVLTSRLRYTEQASLVLSRKVLRIFTDLDFDLQVSLLCLPPETKAEGNDYTHDALE